MSSSLTEAIHDLAAALGTLDVRWYLFGAQAASLRGSDRLTADIDVSVFLGSIGSDALIEALVAHGFEPPLEADHAMIFRTRVVPVRHHASTTPVDLVLGGPGLEMLFLEAAEPLVFAGTEVLVPIPEHLIAMKLIAGRAKDIDDALAMRAAAAVDLRAIRALVEAVADGIGEDGPRRALEEFLRGR